MYSTYVRTETEPFCKIRVREKMGAGRVTRPAGSRRMALALSLGPVGLQDVALLVVREACDDQSAFEARRHLANVVFEVLQPGDGPSEHTLAITEHMDGRVPRYTAVADIDAGRLETPANGEDGPDRGVPLDDVSVDGVPAGPSAPFRHHR